MNLLKEDRATLEEFLPGLDAQLAAIPFSELERPGNPGIKIVREHRGPGLLIPKDYGGAGVTPSQAIRLHRAVASRSPSLAIAMTMHNFSVATLVEYCFYGDYTIDLLKQVAGGQLWVASGFAEGRSGTNILDPTMLATPMEGGFRVTGAKKPCTLSSSFHLLTASVAVPQPDGSKRRAVALVPSDAEGIERRPFWKGSVLAGAESEELILKDVEITEEQLFYPEVDVGLDAVEAGGFLWFELLVSASYLGAAAALVEKVYEGQRGEVNERVQLAIDVEGAMAALDGVALAMATGERGEAILAQGLLVRYSVQQAIERATDRALELLGGMSFIGKPEVGYLFQASRALGFHPPSRLSIAPSLDGYLAGGGLEMA